jgi:hypothetical protein
VRPRTAIVVLAALAAVATALYLRHKRAAAAVPAVRLGLGDGGERELTAGDAGVAELLSAAADLRRGFQAGA